MIKPIRLGLAACALIALQPALSARAAEPSLLPRAQVTTVDIAADASRDAPNDLARATAYFEAQDANAAELARKVNRVVAAGLDTAKAYPAVKAKTGPNSTYPVYGKNGRTIEAWRMTSAILLESRDQAAMSELIGKLQQTMAVSNLTLMPAPDTFKKTVDDATQEAIAAFRAKAKLVADAMGKPYKVRQMSINSAGGPRPMMMQMRSEGLSSFAKAEPAPIAAGDTTVTVNVSGQIELPLD